MHHGGGGGSGGGATGDVLAKYTRDLIAEAAKDRFDPIVGRDVELRRLLQVIARREIRFYGATCDRVSAATGGSRLVAAYGCPAV